MTEREEREQRRVKKMAAKTLPYDIDTAKLLDMVPELDRDKGLGRVLREVMEATKGNFDHLRGELKRTTDYHNEHAEETNFIKDEVIPHEHERPLFRNQVGVDAAEIDGGETGMWIPSAMTGGGDIDINGVDAYSVPTFVPFYIDKPCTILGFRCYIYTASPEQNLRFFAYAGDGDGNYPDTLVYDGLQDAALDGAFTGFVETPEMALDVGAGWLWIGLCTTLSTGTDIAIESWDNGWNHGAVVQSFWPFPTAKWALDTGEVGYYSSISMFTFDPRDGQDTEAPNPFMQNYATEMGLSVPFYSSYAPIIEYRVR